MAQIKLQYLIKDIITKRYEIHELMHDCDPNKGDKENLDDAFVKACSLGANPNKQVRWRFIN